MLSFLISTVCYLGLAWAMVVVIAPYILRFGDERVLVYASIVTAIGIIATLVAIHFLVGFIVTWFIGFNFPDLFSIQTSIVLFFGYMAIKVMNMPMGNEKFV
jgi:hypothetical protein